MPPLPLAVREVTHREEVGALEQAHAVLERQSLTRIHFLGNIEEAGGLDATVDQFGGQVSILEQGDSSRGFRVRALAALARSQASDFGAALRAAGGAERRP